MTYLCDRDCVGLGLCLWCVLAAGGGGSSSCLSFYQPWIGAAALQVKGILQGKPFSSSTLCLQSLVAVCWDQKRLPWLFSFVRFDDRHPRNND